jgi:excisionase family DNA binding protein
MTTKKSVKSTTEIAPMLKTVEQMSRISGIGENRLRELIDNGEIEYVQNGNRRLLADQAIWNWYERNRILPENKALIGGVR